MPEDMVYIRILQSAAAQAGTTLRDPDAADLFSTPLFDDGTLPGRRIQVDRRQIDDTILFHPEGSGKRELGQRALGHYIRRELDKSPK